MKRYFVLFAVLALLALPVGVGADNHGWSWDDTGWMPSWWNPYPPASKPIDVVQLTEVLKLLVKRGMITPQEAAHLTQLQVATPTGQSRVMGR